MSMPNLSKEQLLCQELIAISPITMRPILHLMSIGIDVFHIKSEESIKELQKIINNPEEYLYRLYSILECLTQSAEPNGDVDSNGFIFELFDCYAHRYGCSLSSCIDVSVQQLVIQRNAALLSSGIKLKPFDSIGQDQRLWAQRKRKAQQNNG